MARKTVGGRRTFVDTLRSFEEGPSPATACWTTCGRPRWTAPPSTPTSTSVPTCTRGTSIYRDDQIEVMAVCWQPGQRTVIHTHNGQLGMDERRAGCPGRHQLQVAGLQRGGQPERGGPRLPGRRHRAGPGPPGDPGVLTRRRPSTPWTRCRRSTRWWWRGRSPWSPLHVYSRPIDSCVAFDLEKRTCYRPAALVLQPVRRGRPGRGRPGAPSLARRPDPSPRSRVLSIRSGGFDSPRALPASSPCSFPPHGRDPGRRRRRPRREDPRRPAGPPRVPGRRAESGEQGLEAPGARASTSSCSTSACPGSAASRPARASASATAPRCPSSCSPPSATPPRCGGATRRGPTTSCKARGHPAP